MEEQYVVAEIGEGTYPVNSASLRYRNNATNQTYTAEADKIDGNLILFRMSFEQETDAGSYDVLSLDYEFDGVFESVDMEEAGIEAGFGVNCEVEVNPDARAVDEGEQQEAAGIVLTDAAGEALTPEAFGEAVESAAQGIAEGTQVRSTRAGNLVVVLDPGHGGTDPGAIYFGHKESELALKIAAYCKNELETYRGVTVYMTRSTNQTMGATQVESLDNRVAIAKKYNADVLVSFHLNASENAEANGISVYYPNSNYNPLIGNEGKGLAQKIQKGLVALGLKDNKVQIWNASSDKYPDGSAADYLGLIRRAKLAGFPCVLIEHAFLSNAGDVSNYLSTDEKLKKLGLADATGIAQYYNLSKQTGDEEIAKGEITSLRSDGSGKITIQWKGLSDIVGYEIYRSESLNGNYEKIADVPSNLLTYTDKNATAGTTYCYKIRGKGNGVYGDFSEVKSGFSIGPTTISSVKAQSSGRLLVTWKHVANAYQYEVYRSTAKNGAYKKVAAVSGNTYEDSKVSLNKKYYYKVRTVNRVGQINGYGDDSSVKYGIQAGQTSITSIEQTKNGLKISWKKALGASGYRIYRSTKKKGTYEPVDTVKKGKRLSYTDWDVEAGTTYYYKIQVRNRSGKNAGGGALSKAVSARTAGETSIASVQSVSGAKLKITWKREEKALGYQIARSTSKNGRYKVIKEISSGSKRTYTDTSVQSGKKYYYKISVKSKSNGKIIYGRYCKPVGARALKATQITLVQAAPSAAIELSWKKVTGADGYQIYRSTKKSGGYKRIASVSSGNTLSYKDIPSKTNKFYYYKVRPYHTSGGKKGYGVLCGQAKGKAISVPGMSVVKLNQDGSLQISWSRVNGAVSYELYRKSGTGNFQKIAETTSPVCTYTDRNVVSGVSYQYRVQACNKVNNVVGRSGFSAPVSYMVPFHEIMGAAEVTKEQMTRYYNANISAMQKAYPDKNYGYPSAVYREKGAKDIEEFVGIVFEEAVYEGVKPEVVFAQMCNETYFLQFGGDVTAEQCNFAGIGATGENEPGATFADVRTGIRAQVQHLKAYASKESLRHDCVDPRFIYVKRGSARYVEWLGIQENPYTVWNTDGTIASGCGWATAKNYGFILVSGINKIKSY